VTSQRYVTCSARGGHFSKGLAGYNIGNVQQLAARILTVDFVVCTLAVKKRIRAGFDMSDRTIPRVLRRKKSLTSINKFFEDECGWMMFANIP
jgi:hypothetical protein